MNNYTYLMSCFLLLSLCFSCHRDVIDLDFESIGDQVVIEGYITNERGPYTVKISKTSNYDEEGKFNPVSSADVYISDDQGNYEELRVSRPGHYQAYTLQGVEGRSYTLGVTYEGKEYTATSTMPVALELDSIRFVYNGCCNGLLCYFVDPPGTEDYCAFQVYINRYLAYGFLYQGRFTNGEPVVWEREHGGIQRGDHVQIDFYTIDKSTYEFFSMLTDDTDEDDYDPKFPDIIPIMRSNPETNLSNGALGHFSAMSVRTYSRVGP